MPGLVEHCSLQILPWPCCNCIDRDYIFLGKIGAKDVRLFRAVTAPFLGPCLYDTVVKESITSGKVLFPKDLLANLSEASTHRDCSLLGNFSQLLLHLKAVISPDELVTASAIQRHFVAGQQRLMPEFLAMMAQTVNAYSRLIPGYWAPTDATWGIENRTTALRVIPGQPKSQRVEFRLGSADANPYIVLAATLAAGLYGIEHQLEPLPMVSGNAYDQQHPPELALPTTLMEATTALRSSETARTLFGDRFIEHYSNTREWEWQAFRQHVTDWELQRYFEII